MWNELDRRQHALLSCLDEHRLLCLAALPDRTALSAARWRVAQAGRARMEYLNGTVFPAVEAVCSGPEKTRLEALRDGTPSYQRQVSKHVSRWPTEAIVSDWEGYKPAADAFRSTIQARVAAEVALLRPLLRRQEAIAGT